MQPVDPSPVFDRIAALEEEIVDALCRLVEVPSVCGDAGAAEAATGAIAALCELAGMSVERWQAPGGPPVLFAELDGPDDAPVLLLYGHYDVQPPDPVDAWKSPPFTPTVRDGAVYGRGTGDNKGQFLAHIFAVRALRETVGCPLRVKLLLEGEEESGSPHLAALIAERAQRLSCDLAVTADGPYHPAGHPLIILGVRGLLYLEVSAAGASRDLHSGSSGGIAPAPARALVRALASLWDAAGGIAVPGFYDAVLPPTDVERKLARELPPIEPAPGTAPPDGNARWETTMFEPNVNIAGISCGYGGAGVKTVIPHRASAKIDVRLVADQDPARVFDCMQSFFAAHGVETARLAAVPPSRTPADNPFVQPIRRALQAAWGRPAYVQPRLGGTTPDFVFTRCLGVPSLLVPYGPPDMHHHAPNERMDLEALYRAVRTSASICLQLGELRPERRNVGG